MFSRARVVLGSSYAQLILSKLISSLNWEVWSKVKLSVPIDFKVIYVLNRAQTERNVIFKSRK